MGNNSANSSEPKNGYKTTDKTTTEPWGPSQPQLNQILGQAQQNFNQGVGTAYPQFPTVAGLGSTTTGAIGGLQNLANNPNALTTQSQGVLGSIIGGDPRYADLYNQATGPTASATYLTDMAAGPSNTPNPYLQSLLDQGGTQIADRVKAAYSAKGRYGSNDFTDALARGISEFQTPILYNTYNDALNRQISAAGQIDNANLQGTGLGLSVLGQGQNAQLGGINAATGMQANQLGLFNSLLGAGQYQDQNQQAQLDAQTQKWLWEHGGADQASLNQYLNTVGSIAGLGGTQTTQEPRQPVKTGMGYLTGLLGGLGSLIA